MRKTLTFLSALFFCISFLEAQNKQLLYDFYEIPQSLILNPGVKTPYKWYAGIPTISNITFQAGSSGITVNDLFANDGVDFTNKVRDLAVNGLNQRDEFGISGQIEIFNIGFRNKNRPQDFYSFGMYGEGFFTQYWPEDLAILAFEGNANNIDRRFDLSHLTTQGEAVNVIHFGINRKVNEKLTVGFRAKLYSSVVEFKSVNNTGHFETTAGANNTLRNTLVADLEFKTSGAREFLDILSDNSISAREEFPDLFLKRALLGGNLGLGFDIGFSHQITEKLVLTGSLLDVGFIHHTKDIENYTLKGEASNEGIEIILPDSFADLNSDIWQNLVDDIETQIPFESNEDSYISLRPIKLNASLRYNFGEQNLKDDCYCAVNTSKRNDNVFTHKNAIGGHLYVINRPKGPQAALTAFYQTRIGKALAIKGTYTADKFTLSNVGLGVSFQAGPVNLYVLGDNILSYRNIADSNYASLQFGINIISWNSN